ncbi:hypothetical protein [Natronosalvus halobius]|uniref:hypothetical protein n=1 Tax=Natronosalvus halobius TaxID=2953746 RepID=UPI0020A10816|nr:hypothetical protein [Natronosalvus halobius]USZ70966.1 hypothetical protein NGM15_12815 [Natronosalvus halobius]
MTAGFVAFVLLLSLLVPLVLYVLISDETSTSEVVDRETAEHEAMSLGGRENRSHTEESENDRAGSISNSSERDETDSWGYSRLEDE